ncbi:transcription factor HES-3 [Perognathus longimembris pacificus]|uniref:transcription factor HES-3 n=1 Tax=Perognathus longimembris pacificus TaxID=214514 RepID=UPI00201970CC|nr:transcription factor HES-3 [Perognathus longimembris pacificus]
MGKEPTARGRGNSCGPASTFRKISKPLTEKKRRTRINGSLEQLKSLLEKHYPHQIRKRKLEKADILELSVKYMKSLQNLVQGPRLVPSGAEYPSGFRGCLPGRSQLPRRGEGGSGGLCCPLVPWRAGGSTMDSARPVPAAPSAGGASGPAVPAIWAPAASTGGSWPPPPRLLLQAGLPDSGTSAPAPPPAPRGRAESPGRGLRLWRPW